jgi:ABC-2 type transport system permease protein
MRCLLVAGRVIRQIVKDKRTLALLFVAPVMVIFLLYIVLNDDIGNPRVLAVGLPTELLSALNQDADVSVATELDAAMAKLDSRETDAVLLYADPIVTVRVEGSQSAITASVKKAVMSAVAEYTKQYAQKEIQTQLQAQQEQILKQLQAAQSTANAADGPNSGMTPASGASASAFTLTMPNIQFDYLHGTGDLTSFELIAPLMMGFFIFFFVFILAGVSFLRERISGTLERLLATPIRRYEIVLGYFLGFGVFVYLQTLLIQEFMLHILNIPLKGDFLLVTLINLLLAAGSLALGTLLSAFASSELQLFQFIPIVIVPQILFCGLFSLRDASKWVQLLSKVFPLTYAADALTNVAIRGLGFMTVLPDLLMLFGYMVLFLMLNTMALKKYRSM